MGLRVCFVNFSPSFYRLTLTFVYDFSSTDHPHTHNFPQNTCWLVNVLVSGEEPLLVRRILIKTPLGKPQRLLVKLLLLLLITNPIGLSPFFPKINWITILLIMHDEITCFDACKRVSRTPTTVKFCPRSKHLCLSIGRWIWTKRWGLSTTHLCFATPSESEAPP